MKAGEEHFSRFLEGHEKQFVIPVYQRNYDWNKEHCQKLFTDIMNLIGTKAESYFIGSIVSVFDPTPSKSGEFLIIDGQQRITSVSLLLLAIANLMKQGKAKSNKAHLERQIRETYLVNQYQQDEKRIRLKPIKNDNDAFIRLFSADPDKYLEPSNITSNYKLFEKSILEAIESGILLEDIYDAFKKLMIVDIRLTLGIDNPQAIFESLNSTGKDLDQSDLVRNFILMNKTNEEQIQIYNDYWTQIEANTDYNVTDFVRHFLSHENAKIPNQNRVYAEFKTYMLNEENNCKTAEDKIFEKLKKFSKYYKTFREFDSRSERVNNGLRRLAKLKTTTAFPFLFDVFEANETDMINIDDVGQIIDTLEAFIFRRHICKQPTAALNKIFVSLGRNIRRNRETTGTDYIEVFKYFITYGGRYPDNDLFKESLRERDVYNLKSNHRIHLFERLENYNNRERVDIEGMVNSKRDGLTFEHVMPQTLTPAWKEHLGMNWESVYQSKLNSLGNITLTAYNSEMGNKTFPQKRDKTNGFKDSKLFLNQLIKSCEKWTEIEMDERCEILTQKALEVWPKPTSEFIPIEKENLEFSIFEEKNFTGTKPSGLRIFGEDRSAQTWREVLQKTLSILYDLEPNRIEDFAKKAKASNYLKNSEQKLRSPWKLSNAIYVEQNFSTNGVINFLKMLFEELNIGEDDFSVFLRDT